MLQQLIQRVAGNLTPEQEKQLEFQTASGNWVEREVAEQFPHNVMNVRFKNTKSVKDLSEETQKSVQTGLNQAANGQFSKNPPDIDKELKELADASAIKEEE